MFRGHNNIMISLVMVGLVATLRKNISEASNIKSNNYEFSRILRDAPVLTGTLSCACGEFKITNKAIDGHSVDSGDFPWLVGLIQSSDTNEKTLEPFCWGTLINNRYLLSEASCLFRKNPRDINVFFFGVNITSRRRRSIDKFIFQDNYNRVNHDNNLALLRLTKPLDLNSLHTNVTPICLPDKEFLPSQFLNGQVIMTKRLYHKSVFHSSPLYYFTSFPVHIIRFGDKNCSNIFTERSTAESCADEFGGLCYGERGSVLAMKMNFNKYIGIGVYSKGYGCNGYIGAPPADVSTDVSKHVNWIIKHSMPDGKFCKQ